MKSLPIWEFEESQTISSRNCQQKKLQTLIAPSMLWKLGPEEKRSESFSLERRSSTLSHLYKQPRVYINGPHRSGGPERRIIHKKRTVEWKLFVSPLSHFYSSLALAHTTSRPGLLMMAKKKRQREKIVRPALYYGIVVDGKGPGPTLPPNWFRIYFLTKLLCLRPPANTSRFTFTPVAVKKEREMHGPSTRCAVFTMRMGRCQLLSLLWKGFSLFQVNDSMAHNVHRATREEKTGEKMIKKP